ncbi:hypothetical protein NP233_g6250 [Leucocoprinus birnbaumii]|uniref:Amidase domain-containing protein n=1 Tax=Leucocoprinus birnbaumii TaxID=56174 RepID=A0AAD5YTU6_9AGAR|nr:hypothetical protein NP233_g6250 [Leucocoprinus birnbaumii]
MSDTSWQDRAAAKRRQQLESIPKDWVLPNLPPRSQLDVNEYPRTCGLLTAKEVQITESSVETLLVNLSQGTWSSVEVTTAFSKRAVIAHQLVNCLTEIFIERALERAAGLDEHFKRTGQVVGPLHGLPVSIKDMLMIKGIDTTNGYIGRINQPAPKNAALVDILESLGAVPYVKTNIPQTLMWGESYNHIFGRTLNPFNRNLTAGGSSGGEGALVGLGSDIGGSIRIPAAFNSLYGFRPSYNRLPTTGGVGSGVGQNTIYPVYGPLTTSMDGIKTFMRSILSKEPWQYDPLVIRKSIVPDPPVTRGLEIAKAALLRAGHKGEHFLQNLQPVALLTDSPFILEVIDWKPANHAELCRLGWEILAAGGSADVDAVLATSGEPLIPDMSLEVENFDAEAWQNVKNTQVPRPGLTTHELWQLNGKLRQLRHEYHDQWRETISETGTGRPVDAIIAPVAPFVATPHGKNRHYNYTFIWNVLDYPCCAIPVGSKVDPQLDAKRPRASFCGDADRQNWDSYDPNDFMNAPLSIHIVSRTLEDEAVVGISEVVDNALKARESAI